MPIKTVDATTLKQWMESGEAIIVDVREPAEYEAEHIKGATLAPLSALRPTDLPKHEDKKLVIHCRKGGRGNSACEKLVSEQPDLEIYNLEGGISAWAAQGFAVQTGGKKILPLDQQVQLTIGLSVLTGSILGYAVNPLFFLLSGFFGAGLTFAGLTGFCGLAMLMAKMPWNRSPKSFCKTPKAG